MVHFLKYRWLYFVISLLVIGAGVFSMFMWGFRFSIDFVGGSNLEYSLKKAEDAEKVKEVLKKNKVEIVQITQKDKNLFIKTKTLDEKQDTKLNSDLRGALGPYITILRSETVSPTLGKEMIQKTIIASVIAIFGILIYMSFTFKSIYFALSAIIALIHDFLVVVGTYSLFSHFFGAEVDLLFVTALLTTMSFSVHDTIVIFDKIREYGKTNKGEVEYYANRALTETLVRSLNNSMTIIFMLLALILLGGSTIKFFVAALLVGTITGTYSSPFVATPILVWMEKRKK